MGKSELVCDCETIHHDIVEDVKNHILPDDTLLLITNFYKAFSDNTRIKIINALDHHEMCVCDIAVLLNMTKSAVSHQLKYLRKLNIIKPRKVGKIVFYSLADDHVKTLFEICHEHIKEEQNEQNS